jgi:gluconate kinase
MFLASTMSLGHVMTVAEQFEVVVVCTSAGAASREQLQHLNEELSQTTFVFLNATDMSDPEKWQRQVEQAVKER